MILEHAELSILPGREAEFEQNFSRARDIISSMPGFLTLRLSRCLERPSNYLLLVEWESVTDHTEGFRRSVQYDDWKELLHQFYEPFPDVEHFVTVLTA